MRWWRCFGSTCGQLSCCPSLGPINDSTTWLHFEMLFLSCGSNSLQTLGSRELLLPWMFLWLVEHFIGCDILKWKSSWSLRVHVWITFLCYCFPNGLIKWSKTLFTCTWKTTRGWELYIWRNTCLHVERAFSFFLSLQCLRKYVMKCRWAWLID